MNNGIVKTEILVVDDSRIQSEMLRDLLAREGYAVRTALDGREALESARQQVPHLIISDIEMPIMNGYGLSREVKTDPLLEHIPVILLTTLSRAENILRALEARADYYLTKPYDSKYLLSRIKTLLETPIVTVGNESQSSLEVVLEGARHSVTAGRSQMLNLLLCTYEHAVQQNRAITRVQGDVQAMNAQLRRQTLRSEASRANFLALLENSVDAMIVVDRGGVVRYVNAAAVQLFSRPREEFVDRPFEWMLVGGDAKEVDIKRPQVTASGVALVETVVAELRVVETEWEGEGAYMATLRDITQRKRAEAQIVEQQRRLQEANEALETLATSDALTGLKNRRAFMERLSEEMRRASRYKMPLSLLLCDVDKFKGFNDSFGHPAGDEVLKRVAKILGDGARTSDFVARYGGEEFVVILPNTDSENSQILAQRLRTAIESASWDLREVTISGGAATLVPHAVGEEALSQESERLINEADKALYAAKANGRNRIETILIEAA